MKEVTEAMLCKGCSYIRDPQNVVEYTVPTMISDDCAYHKQYKGNVTLLAERVAQSHEILLARKLSYLVQPYQANEDWGEWLQVVERGGCTCLCAEDFVLPEEPHLLAYRLPSPRCPVHPLKNIKE